mmetsp:Transcript_126990/g.301598  ORF Transcript_126990/g.301598 Transcript_126990/m.301598 type:complete len:251 (+) Transcript_126990:2146-2898(+)
MQRSVPGGRFQWLGHCRDAAGTRIRLVARCLELHPSSDDKPEGGIQVQTLRGARGGRSILCHACMGHKVHWAQRDEAFGRHRSRDQRSGTRATGSDPGDAARWDAHLRVLSYLHLQADHDLSFGGDHRLASSHCSKWLLCFAADGPSGVQGQCDDGRPAGQPLRSVPAFGDCGGAEKLGPPGPPARSAGLHGSSPQWCSLSGGLTGRAVLPVGRAELPPHHGCQAVQLRGARGAAIPSRKHRVLDGPVRH